MIYYKLFSYFIFYLNPSFLGKRQKRLLSSYAFAVAINFNLGPGKAVIFIIGLPIQHVKDVAVTKL